MDKWFKDILPDKDPYHNRGREQILIYNNLSHSVNRVGSQLQPELGYMHPSFLKYATKVKLSTGAGLLVLVRDGTRYSLKMVIGTS